MNDTQETVYYLERLFESAEKVYPNSGSGLYKLKQSHMDLYSLPTYLISFTENEDDDQLHIWYCNNERWKVDNSGLKPIAELLRMMGR